MNSNNENINVLANPIDMTIDEIAYCNSVLTQKLRLNLKVLDEKRKLSNNDLIQKKLLELLNSQRKIFAFKIIYPGKLVLDYDGEIFTFITKIFQEFNAKIVKIFNVNNYVYLKVNKNILYETLSIQIREGLRLEQINPKDILKCQFDK